MRRSSSLLLVILLPSLTAGLACQTTPRAGESKAPLETTTDAYQAYERGDCDEIERSARNAALEDWPATEARSSFLLVEGFCAERADDLERARRTYRQLLREAPLSFASDDARERLRVMRLRENDPEYAEWVAGARVRALQGSTDRTPVERAPASYPPLAQVARIGGYAIVEFGVTPRGDTDAPVIVDSNPPLLFDGVALRAVREWRYASDADGTQSERQAIRLVFKPEDAERPDLEAPVEPSAN
ncbi:MAG: TonB family protein [Myxococcota bacterium]